MRPADGPLGLRHAVALGLAQGPTELLPISSSAHTALIPWLAGWPYGGLDPELRKSFEVVLHAATAAALLLDAHPGASARVRGSDRRSAAFLVLSAAPAAIVGYALEAPIQRRLGAPPSIAAGLAAGAVAMALCDRVAPSRGPEGEVGSADALALGLAQALALVPGVSRRGATLAAARARGFSRPQANDLSWRAALPVLLGAGTLKGVRLARLGTPRGAGGALAAGGIAAFLSTRVSTRLARNGRFDGPLLPYAIYRLLLAALVARRLSGAHNREP